LTAACLVRRAAVLEAGNFDETRTMAEDRDLGERLQARGWKVRHVPELTVRVEKRDTVASVLERYRRWNASSDARPSWREYARLVGYAVKVMVKQDLRAGDVRAAANSLWCPHVQFWRGRVERHGK
jgi:GT2 family glycosyltransferase